MSLFDSEQATLDEFVLELKHSSVADSIALTPDDADDKRVSNKKYLLHKKLGVHLVEKFNRYYHYQGQARGYGRITHFLPLPLRGHHFQRATVTQWLDRFQIPGYQMKDMDIVFPLIPNGLL